MADMALFIGWGETVRGREAKAVQVFGEAMAYYQRLQDQGEIESSQSASWSHTAANLEDSCFFEETARS